VQGIAGTIYVVEQRTLVALGAENIHKDLSPLLWDYFSRYFYGDLLWRIWRDCRYA